jgi:hypothetical protein
MPQLARGFEGRELSDLHFVHGLTQRLAID